MALALVVAACGGPDPRQAGGLSAGEADALDSAAATIDARRVSPELVPPLPSGSAAPPANPQGSPPR